MGKKTAGSDSIKNQKPETNKRATTVHVMHCKVCQLEGVIKMHRSIIYFSILRLQEALKVLFLSKDTKSATRCGINLQATPTTPTA